MEWGGAGWKVHGGATVVHFPKSDPKFPHKEHTTASFNSDLALNFLQFLLFTFTSMTICLDNQTVSFRGTS